MSPAPSSVRLTTVGHGTLAVAEMVALLQAAGLEAMVDIRSAPGSRRNPHLAREAMAAWLPEAGIAYRWEPRLGGWRKARERSANVGLHNLSFRGYADHMEEPEFAAALAQLMDEARRAPAVAMCSETLWWRCHRRLVADAAVLVAGADVVHLGHDGRLSPHRVTAGAARLDGRVRYGPEEPTLPGI